MWDEGIDIGQLVIEGRIPQLSPKSKTAPHPNRPYFDGRVRRDLVIRRRRHDGFFRFRGEPDYPFAVMEWKPSVEDRTPKSIRDGYENDLRWLPDNASLMQVGYCVLIEWPAETLKITCARVCDDEIKR